MGNINENKDMNTGPSMERPVPTHMVPMGGKKSNRGMKILLWLLICLLLLAGGGAAGYFYGQYKKNQEVEQAKQEAQNAAQAEISKIREETNKQNTTPEKSETNTTCNADELSLALESPDANTGTYSYDLVFTNTGSRSCTLYGYPGVSLVNDNGNMIGLPAERFSESEATMTLAPQGRVKAVLYAENSLNFSDGQCKTGATKLRVYPPNDTGYLSVATDTNLTSWCPGFQVTPVMAI